MGIYMQDYGGPIGNRIIAKHPDWLQLKWQSCGCKQGGRELVQP
jgi:hypothetical protein